MYSAKKVVVPTERLDASISSQHSGYGSTTLKSRASPTNSLDPKAEINNAHVDSDDSVGHRYNNNAVTGAKDSTYHSTPSPITTYTSSLFAAASKASSAPRFPRYAYSRMETYIDENPGARKSVSKTLTLQYIETFIFVLNQMCIGFVTIYMSWLCITNGLQKTPLHAWLVTIGYSLLMAEGVMVHYNANPLTTHYKRHDKHTIHWVLQLAGGGLGMGGTLYKCIQKGFLLTSIHGKLGFTTFILCLVSWLSGLTALYQLKIKSYVRPIFNRTIHNFIGFSCFALALVTQYFGYQTGFFSSRTDSDFRNCIQIITLISLVLSCIGPIKALLQKARIIFRD